MLKKIVTIVLLVCNVFIIFSMFVAAKAQDEGTMALPILMYHHIHSSPSRWGTYVVSPETFEGDLQYLQENGYTTVSMAELLAFVQGEGELPEKPVMITFDDGQVSFETYALPLLEKYGMCAVLSVVGCYTDTYTECMDHNYNYACFSWIELVELAASPYVELASHSYNMHSNSNGRMGCKIKQGEDVDTYTRIFSADLASMEEHFLQYLGEKPFAFAYPYGGVCAEAKAMLQENGYSILFTCREHVNQLTGDPQELLSLGRFNRPNSMSRKAYFAQFDS